MSLNLIAILVSLAMMLTGAGGGSQPAETARTLVLNNINVTYNGRSLRLGPRVHAGVSTDGQKAVYEFGIGLDDQQLMPVQLVADDSGVTALTGKNGVAVTVTGRALAGLSEQLEGQLNASMADAGEDGARLIRFILDEYLPAYAGVVQMAMNPEAYAEINAACQAVFDRMVDRGPATPTTVEVNGESYQVSAYSYSLDALQMAALSDAIYAGVPALSDYYNALFGLYALLPEESGLTHIDSFIDLFMEFGLEMKLDIEEQRSDDGGVDVINGTLIIDPNTMVAAQAAEAVPVPRVDATEAPLTETPQPDGGAAAAAIEPVTMQVQNAKAGDYAEATVQCAYALSEAQDVEINLRSSRQEGMQEADSTVIVSERGRKVLGVRLSGFIARDISDAISYSVNLKGIRQDVARVSATLYGTGTPEGLSENNVSIEAQTQEENLDVSFDLNVTGDPIEDMTAGVEPACVIDDLSEAGIESLCRNPAAIGAAMQALGILTSDVARLKAEPGVSGVLSLLKGESLPIDVDDLDADDELYAFEFDGEAGAGDNSDEAGADMDFDDEPIEDDGVLAFAQPQMTWLPQGWAVTNTRVDTAYDTVEMTVSDPDGMETVYAIFFRDPDAATNYIVEADGKVLDGRLMNVSDYGEGGLSVTVSENGLYGNLMFSSEAIELDTIGQIVAGIRF